MSNSRTLTNKPTSLLTTTTNKSTIQHLPLSSPQPQPCPPGSAAVLRSSELRCRRDGGDFFDFDSVAPADREPMLLVSGMGGSILHSKNKKSGAESRVWVRIWLVDLKFKKKLWSLYNPSTVCEVVTSHRLVSFHDMIKMLIECGYVKGTTLFGFRYDFRQSNRYVVECPSSYELMPNPGHNWKETEDKAPSVKLETYGPLESSSVFEEALRTNELSYQGKTVPLPFNFGILKWATKSRQVISNAQLPEGVSSYNIYGTSFDTPFHVRYGTESSPIVDLSEICHTLPEYSFVDGYETVPTESTKADGYAAKERVGGPCSPLRTLVQRKSLCAHQKMVGSKHQIL
ncbi:Phospholipase A(1) LCAT3-like protein [Drosera capensis]